MNKNVFAHEILKSRRYLKDMADKIKREDMDVEEGGCGVTGFACNIPVSGKHIFEPSVQMHNRGNGKGGGLAAVGLIPEKLGIDRKTLDEDFLLQIAILDKSIIPEMEARYIRPFFRIDHEAFADSIDDYRDIKGLEVKPPDVKRYFVRVKQEVLSAFKKERGLEMLSSDKAEEEFIYQNSFRLNYALYSSLRDKKAFVLSHGRNMMILKIVGYAEQVAQYYKLENFDAHIWIAHQRYPTKGRMWHPGGAHPFIGLDEALVHNGDFANYFSMSEYLKQRNVYPLFLTDTEVSILVFDLMNRVYGYPLEYIIEAFAPTGEMDFDKLPEDKQQIYKQIQNTHIHGSPDGPWFFIIARNDIRKKQFQLIGITDTAMLRPQVFALQKGDVEIGLICSEKQAIDATLVSLAKEDKRFGTIADSYWNARGGSYTDGGAFMFTIEEKAPGKMGLTCTDKFGRVIDVPGDKKPADFTREFSAVKIETTVQSETEKLIKDNNTEKLFTIAKDNFFKWDYNQLSSYINMLTGFAKKDSLREPVIKLLTLLLDRHYLTGQKSRRSILQMLSETLDSFFESVPIMNGSSSGIFSRINFSSRDKLRKPEKNEKILVADADGFEPEGDNSFAGIISKANRLGWKQFICYNQRGQRFLGCGFGSKSDGVRIDSYGSSGDYLGSGIDGLEIHVHGNAQDQLGQIMMSGKLVIHGDVGQTFMYGAKGGEVYVLGNAAGRPFINAVGKPRIVINGTALDFLAESFMAGDPYNGGGFVILNGLTFNEEGNVVPLEVPYAGSNLFSLASGGAIFVRDPFKKIVPEQLNGGVILPFTDREWNLILPYLQENERLFGISINEHLLTVNGKKLKPEEIFRTVGVVKSSAQVKKEFEMNEEWGESE